MTQDPKHPLTPIAAPDPDNVSTELQFRVAKALMGTVEDCYDSLLARALSVAHSNPITAGEAATMERKLKKKYGKDLNLVHLRQGVKTAGLELVKDNKQSGEYLYTNEGGLKGCLANAITMMKELPLVYDSFSCRPFLSAPSPWGTSGPWNDTDDVKASEWCQRNGLMIEKHTAADAAESVAKFRDHFHPVVAYLKSLVWDGEHRVDQWLHKCMGAPDNAYTRAVAMKWLVAAIKRVMEPGCQSDYTIVLEGAQGKRKSSALRILAGEWFTDDIPDIGTKDSAIQLQGKWIIEIAELDAFRRAEMTTIKAWLVRREDRYRSPYGRRAADYPRQNVFAASTNKDDWGLDDTGLRRFWPVRVGDIDIELLKSVRDQLWAEAKFRYDEGETSFLSENIEVEAAGEQHERQDQDAWKDEVEDWANAPSGAPSLRSVRGRIYLPEVLQYCLGMPKKEWSHQQKMRVTRILRLAGYIARRATRAEAEEDGSRPEYWVKDRGW